MTETLRKHEEKIKITSANEATWQIAKQLSHDIRSPLAALNMIVHDNAKFLPEDARIAMRQQADRILDIANELLLKSKEDGNSQKEETGQLSTQLLIPLIEEILTEKRLNFRSMIDLYLEGDIYSEKNYDLFAEINLVEMKRLVSNLINNAAESLIDGKGKIVVRLKNENEKYIKIDIVDNGKGIPDHVLQKLGKQEVSFGKDGFGLGVLHAQKKITSWQGSLNINSNIGLGTTVSIMLPKVSPPHWFVTKLQLKNKQKIVVFDDDQGIHQTWAKRLQEHSLIHIATPLAFTEFMNNSGEQQMLILSDYEFIGYKETGLDLLEKFHCSNAILVTSHYENEQIRERCKNLNIKLIPKMLAGIVPIMINDSFYDAVYIEDDYWLRMGWQKIAKQKNIKLLCIDNPYDFYQNEERISKEDTAIYLDSNLGEGKKRGEEIAEELHLAGYKKLYLATGYDACDLPYSPWLTVIGKKCPF